MKKNFTFKQGLSLALLMGCSSLFAQICTPEPTLCSLGDMINEVKVNGVGNKSECSPKGYGDYTKTVAPFGLIAGASNEIEVTVSDGFEQESVMLWIDLNKNDVFDLDEYFFIGTADFGVAGGGVKMSLKKSIELSADVEVGEYRARFRVLDGAEHHAKFACDVYFWDDEGQIEVRWPYGETEDYLVTVSKADEVTYCAPVDIMCEDDDAIHQIKFLDIDNSSTCNLETGYSNYRDLKQTVAKGQTFDLTAVIGSGWKYESLGVWIDYNQDGDLTEDEFTLVGSVVYPSNTNNGLTTELKKTITIPETALEGETLMRFRIRATGSDQPDITWDAICEDEDFGEIEDYTLVIGSLGVHDLSSQKEVTIAKNAGELFALSKEVINALEIYSFEGKQVKKVNVNAKEVNLSLYGLKKGVYVLKMTLSTGEKVTKKIIL